MSRRGARYWVDGYNAILGLELGAGDPMELRRNQLVQRAAGIGRPVWVVFDSRESVPHPRSSKASGRVRVHFTREGMTADELLVDRVRAERDLDGLVVVSDDQPLVARCRFHGARTMGTRAFARLLAPRSSRTPLKQRRLTRSEVEDWMEYLGFAPRSAPGNPRNGVSPDAGEE